MTPKSLLRHKRCVSHISELTSKSSFHRVLEDDAYFNQNKLIKLQKDKNIKKVVLCSGKIYYDLIEEREKNKNDKVVFIRLEQLYPFPCKNFSKFIKKIQNSKIYMVSGRT